MILMLWVERSEGKTYARNMSRSRCKRRGLQPLLGCSALVASDFAARAEHFPITDTVSWPLTQKLAE